MLKSNGKYNKLRCGAILFKMKNKKYNFNLEKRKRMTKKEKNFIKNNIQFLCIQRRNSYAYQEFINGKYNDDVYRIYELLNGMTNHERNVVLKADNFQELIKLAWVKNPKIRKGSMEKFNKFINGNNEVSRYHFTDSNSYLSNFDNNPRTPIEFPKGIINKKELPFKCALRELREETGIKKSDYMKPLNIQFDETMIGTDKNYYHNKYFMLHLLKDPLNTEKKEKFIKQNNEVINIEWYSYQELKKIFSGSITKKNILKKIIKYIGTVIRLQE